MLQQKELSEHLQPRIVEFHKAEQGHKPVLDVGKRSTNGETELHRGPGKLVCDAVRCKATTCLGKTKSAFFGGAKPEKKTWKKLNRAETQWAQIPPE